MMIQDSLPTKATLHSKHLHHFPKIQRLRMDGLIPIINRLEHVFHAAGKNSSSSIQLPRIAVVGCQSSGKSSVLENLVGQPFLPRGKDIVTRCPVMLMLRKTEGGDEWVEFSHAPAQRFAIPQVEQEIRRRTKEIAGATGISRETIKLSVYSPNVLTLTLIDLPGLVKVAVKGQPSDIAEQIRELVLEYVSPANTLILAVSPGNVDIANSDAMNLAKMVDPQQTRTIAVITKLDLAEDVGELLSGKLLPVKLGIVGVVNRSQAELESNALTNAQVVEKERRILEGKYPSMANRHGGPYLAARLTSLLAHHIEKGFPALELQIKGLILQKEASLEFIGPHPPSSMSPRDKLQALSAILFAFERHYKAQVDGQGRTEMDPTCLSGGAAIDTIFEEFLAENLWRMDPLEAVSDAEILTAVRNSEGVASSMALPQAALTYLVKREVRRMKPVVVDTATKVHSAMIAMIEPCLAKARSSRFPFVDEKIVWVVQDLLEKRARIAKRLLEEYIDVQACSSKTFDEGYCGELVDKMGSLNAVGLGDVSAKGIGLGMRMPPIEQVQDVVALPPKLPFRLGSKRSKKGSTLERMLTPGEQSSNWSSSSSSNSSGLMDGKRKGMCEIVKGLVERYFEIVRRQVQDFAFKALLHSLVYYTVSHLSIALTTTLAPLADELIREAEHVEEKRRRIQEELEGLKEACKILEEVRNDKLIG